MTAAACLFLLLCHLLLNCVILDSRLCHLLLAKHAGSQRGIATTAASCLFLLSCQFLLTGFFCSWSNTWDRDDTRGMPIFALMSFFALSYLLRLAKDMYRDDGRVMPHVSFSAPSVINCSHHVSFSASMSFSAPDRCHFLLQCRFLLSHKDDSRFLRRPEWKPSLRRR